MLPNEKLSRLLIDKHRVLFFYYYYYRAGVGRTGTFIAIEGCLRQMEQDKRVDIFGTVCQMRRQRNFMVQTEV